MKKASLLAVAMFALGAAGIVAAQSITYDFDDVEVRYAAEFTAMPIAKPAAADPENWIVRIAGGTDKPITVLYGVVHLKKGGMLNAGNSDEFIKVSGAGGSERFLVTSATYDYYEETTRMHYKNLNSFFWSAKKLVGNRVVKDFTPPITSISMHRAFNQSEQLQSIVLSFSNDGQRAGDEFWTAIPSGNFYEVKISTLNQSGVSTANATQVFIVE